MSDAYGNYWPELNSPAKDAFAITPSDGADLAATTRGIYVGTGGDIALVTKEGTTVTFADVPGGGVLPIRATRVLATGTTALNLVGMV